MATLGRLLDAADRYLPDSVIALIIVFGSLGLMAAGGLVEWTIFSALR